MKSTYDVCLPLLLAHEGGYSNHPSDPGGPTNFGITIFDYRKYVNPGATAADVRAMTVEEAKRIYRARYWDAQRCDELPAGLERLRFLQSLRTWPIFGAGWGRRVAEVKAAALAMVAKAHHDM